ncbi:MAG: imidazolonepropionase [Acidimicrobiia bacterium]
MSDLLVFNIGQLVTNDPGRQGVLGAVDNAGIAVVDGLFEWVGPDDDVPDRYRDLPRLDAGGAAVLPGFVDSHTHLVFAGDRSEEFDRRLRGESYEQILESGGGILSSVAATRAATDEQLFDDAAARVWRMLANGTTTVEIKSGYGLDTETEARMLRVANRLDEMLPMDVVPTFLGAHVVPSESRADRKAYVDLVCGPMLDACAPLARFCDVFCDEAAFSVAEARRILEAARSRGLDVRIHADQLGRVGAAALAADIHAASADHLDHATNDDLALMRSSGTAAVLLPAVSFSMRLPYPDGRAVWDSGVSVALATDCNPGTAYVESMPFVISLAVLNMGLTTDQAIWAATLGGAYALGLDDRGRVVPGAIGDLAVLDAPSRLHLAYRPAADIVAAVVKRGEIL